MPIQNKNETKVITILLIAISVISCSTVPSPPTKKPKIPICTLDIPRNECICSVPGEDDFESVENFGEFVSQIEVDSSAKRRPISECDKFVATSPKGWEKLQNTLEDAINYIQTYCNSNQCRENP